MEEGLRDSNPVGRERYMSGRRGSGNQGGSYPSGEATPWIPTEQQWADILEVAAAEPVRNRVMLALTYDAALRREELCALRTDDLDPAHRALRIRAETPKNRLELMCRTRLRPNGSRPSRIRVVESAFAWINKYRRACETRPVHHVAVIRIAMIPRDPAPCKVNPVSECSLSPNRRTLCGPRGRHACHELLARRLRMPRQAMLETIRGGR
ncbi:site-specific integrase [Rhodococcus qingshengii]|uniref:site-specific integrase n=1 Tax=Rhodococcus qingshengii TaxID=334542 RepID=UPI001BEB16B8|nr:site-specific integrase [Rhodococcus qingshengii]MBT2272188.1 site-specific integrase [Rhodococcus qingshengii]